MLQPFFVLHHKRTADPRIVLWSIDEALMVEDNDESTRSISAKLRSVMTPIIDRQSRAQTMGRQENNKC
jgi:hypothetical protein